MSDATGAAAAEKPSPTDQELAMAELAAALGHKKQKGATRKSRHASGAKPLSDYLAKFKAEYMDSRLTPAEQALKILRNVKCFDDDYPRESVLLYSGSDKEILSPQQKQFNAKHWDKGADAAGLARPAWIPAWDRDRERAKRALAAGGAPATSATTGTASRQPAMKQTPKTRQETDDAHDCIAGDTVVVGFVDNIYPVYLWRLTTEEPTNDNFWFKEAKERAKFFRVVPPTPLARLHREKGYGASADRSLDDFAAYTQLQAEEKRRVKMSGGGTRTIRLCDIRHVLWLAGHMDKSRRKKEGGGDGGKEEEEEEAEEEEEEEKEVTQHAELPVPVAPPPAPPTTKKPRAKKAKAPAAADGEIPLAASGGAASTASAKPAYDEARTSIERRLTALHDAGVIQQTLRASLETTALEPPDTWAVASAPGQWPFPKIMPTNEGQNKSARWQMQGGTWQYARDLLANTQSVDAFLQTVATSTGNVIELSADETHLLVIAVMAAADPGKFIGQAMCDGLGMAAVEHSKLNDHIDQALIMNPRQSEELVNAYVALLHAVAITKAFHGKTSGGGGGEKT